MKTHISILLFSLVLLFCHFLLAEEFPRSLTRPGQMSFPDDIQFRSNTEEGGQIVYDAKSVYPKYATTIQDKDMGDIRRTLELAKSQNAMVLIEDIIKGSVQIPVAQLDPRSIRFVTVIPEDWSSWLKSFVIRNSYIEIWSDDTFVGTTCFGCSASSIDEHIEQFETFIQQAIYDGLESIEVNLTKDSENILVRDSNFKFYDPAQIGIQPLYFKEQPNTPGGFQVFEFQDNLKPINVKHSVLYVAGDSLVDEVFLDNKNIFFQPVQQSRDAITFSYLTFHQINRQKVKVKGVVVVDRLSYFRIQGYESRIFAYSEMMRTFARVLAQAMSEGKRVVVNRGRGVYAMQMLLTVE